VKILVISPAFPPVSSVGVVRMTSLTAYLVREGHEITVICDESNSQNSNGNDIYIPDGISIIRVPFGKKENSNRAILYKNTVETLLNAETYDVALITVGPYYTLRFCYKVFPKYGIKYILDFRDVGAFEHIKRTNIFRFVKIVVSRIFEGYFEFRSIANTEYVISVTEGWRKKKQNDYRLFKNKMLCIENGYDSERLKGIELPFHLANHKISIMGKLAYYSEHYATILFEALKIVAPLYDETQFVHICDEEIAVDNIMRKLEFEKKYYHVTGFLDYPQGIKLLSDSSINVIVDDRKAAMGTKIYDYLYLNRPIIYVGSPNTTISKFVSQFEYGFSCSTVEEVVYAIKYIFNNDISILDSKYIKENYSREHQNEKYTRLLESITNEDGING